MTIVVAALLTLPPAVPASANVICAVVERGRTTCTYFCQNGFICDLANRKCLPGPERLKEAQRLLDKSNRIKRNLNSDRIRERSAKEAQMFGFQRGQYYYKWDGNPKEMPTPRYRPQYSFGYSKGSASQSRPAHLASSNTLSRLAVRSYLATLLASAQRLPAGDPSRANIIATARTLVQSNNIPFDVDGFLCRAAPLPASTGGGAPFVQWTVTDVEQEVRDRGLCPEAEADRSACIAKNFGVVVLDVEPEIKARCKAQEQDPQEQKLDALATCADRMLRNAWSQSKPPSNQVRASAEQCPPPPASASRPDSADDLRRRLRAALAAAGEGDEAPESEAAPPPKPASSEPEQAATQSPSDPDVDEAFCAYIARKSVRGELTPGDGTPIPDYCKKAFDTAKSCTEQSCSMADVIAEEERRQKSNALPWGAADREKIAALQKPLLDTATPSASSPTVNAPMPPAPTPPTVSAPVAPGGPTPPTVTTPTTPSPTASAPQAAPTTTPPTVSTPTVPSAPTPPTVTTPTTPSPTVIAPSPPTTAAPSPTVQAPAPRTSAPNINSTPPTVQAPTVNPQQPSR